MIRKFVLAATAIALSTAAQAERDSFGLGIIGGTLGVGLSVTAPINDYLNARATISGLDISVDDIDVDDEDGIDGNELTFDGDAELGAVGALLDYHPFRGGLRVSTGLMYTRNKFEGEGRCDASPGSLCEIGDATGVISRNDRVRGEVDYSGFAPYFGLGWGNAVDEAGRWSFSFDLGVMYTGEPDVSVSCSQVANPASRVTCQQEADREEDELEDEIGDYEFYPVLQFGAAYRF